jgi:hypothetical protein
MRSWRIHVVWAVVTVIVAAAWGHHVSTRVERERRDDHDLRRNGERPSPQNGGPSGLTSEAPDSSKAAPPEKIPSQAPAPDPPTPVQLTPDQIRTMLRDKKTWARAFEALKVLQERPLKLKILEECLALGAVEIRIPISAFMQLGEMGGADAAEIVEKALRGAEDERTRYRAARALAQIQEPRSLAVFLETYQLDPLDLKVLCAGALQKLGHAGPASEILTRLTRSLDDPDGAIRRESLEYISSLKTAAALPVLMRCLNDSNGDVRSEAISGLESLAIPEVLPLLERACQDPNPSVAEDARRALERLRRPKEKAKS